jgi:hypothetical protein
VPVEIFQNPTPHLVGKKLGLYIGLISFEILFCFMYHIIFIDEATEGECFHVPRFLGLFCSWSVLNNNRNRTATGKITCSNKKKLDLIYNKGMLLQTNKIFDGTQGCQITIYCIYGKCHIFEILPYKTFI